MSALKFYSALLVLIPILTTVHFFFGRVPFSWVSTADYLFGVFVGFAATRRAYSTGVLS
jgi:hypothetical protein